MKQTNKLYLIILLLAIALNIGVIVAIQNYTKAKVSKAHEAEQPQKLERLHSLFSYTKLFEKKYKDLFEQIEGKTLAEIEVILDEWFIKTTLPKEALRIIVYNEHTPLNLPPNEAEDWEFVMDILDSGDYQRIRVKGEAKNRVIKILQAGVGFETIECRPGQHTHLGVTDLNTYGIWFKSKKKYKSDEVTHALILTHSKYLQRDKVAKALFDSLKINKEKYGYLNLNNLDEEFLPDSISGQQIRNVLNLKDVRSGFEKLKLKGLDLYASYKPNGDTFIAVASEPFVPLPFFAVALFYFWFPFWMKLYVNRRRGFKLPLPFLFVFLFCLVILTPGILIYFHLNSFLESKYNSIRLNKIKEMENALIQVDTNSQEIYRVHQHIFKELAAIMDKKPEKIQEFIDKSLELELNAYFDACIIIDKDGDFTRKYASVSAFVRSLPLYPEFFKESVIKQALKNGWVPFDRELEYVREHNQENFTIDAFLAMNPEQGQRATSSIVKIIAKDLINQHNSKLDRVNLENTDTSMSSTIIGSLVGDDNENPVATIQNSLGEFFDFGYAKDNSRNFVELIKDENDVAKHCLILFSGLYNFNRSFLRRLFSDQNKWPKGIGYLVITPKIFCLNFPYLDLYERLERITNIMQPPTTMYTEEVIINGVPHLLCAYAAQKTEYHVYVAYTPLSILYEELDSYKKSLTRAVLLTLLSLCFILYRLFKSIIYPTNTIMQGVSAMAAHKNDHRIALYSGDEWEHLANTLNNSLESMKELEIATFLQDTILPTETISCHGLSFSGKTISLDGVGGDYYDAFIHNENEMLFVIGDVSGHSVSAALVVSMAHAAFSYFYDIGLTNPQEILHSINSLMLTNLQRVKMMTCFVGYITKEGALISSNAGQAYPIIVDEDGMIEYVANISYPLGSSKRAKYLLKETPLPSRCRIILYSDGIAEAVNEQGEFFGYDRLENFIKKHACNGTSEDFYRNFFDHFMTFTGSVPWGDDCTLAIIEYHKTSY